MHGHQATVLSSSRVHRHAGRLRRRSITPGADSVRGRHESVAGHGPAVSRCILPVLSQGRMLSNVPAGVLSESLGHTRGMALGSFVIGIGAMLTAAANGAFSTSSENATPATTKSSPCPRSPHLAEQRTHQMWPARPCRAAGIALCTAGPAVWLGRSRRHTAAGGCCNRRAYFEVSHPARAAWALNSSAYCASLLSVDAGVNVLFLASLVMGAQTC